MQTRRVAILAPFLAVVALVAGCTGSPSSDAADPATVLKESSATTKAQTSAHLLLVVDGEIPELPIEMIEGDLTQTPEVAASGAADMLFLGQHLKGVEFVVYGGDLWAAYTAGSAMSNLGPASNVYDVAAILSPDVGLANVLANFTDATADGNETVEGVNTMRITGNVAADAVNKIVPQLGAKEPVPGTVWIAKEGDHELVQAQLEPSTGNTITMTLTKWGDPVTVDQPAP
jgi:lipoprotein LprG